MFNFLFQEKKPTIKENTFIVWEPCSKSHSEVVPGYAKYLLDLGYNVTVLVEPERYKEGLFSKFEHKNLTLDKLKRHDILKYFKNSDLSEVQGLMITTIGKLCDDINFNQVYSHFKKNVDKNKIYMVEHEAAPAVDAGKWREDLIILRKLNYKNKQAVVVNPHYFGNVKITEKNKDITNFVTVGAITKGKKNTSTIINAALELKNKGYDNFKVTVIGKGSLNNIPKAVRKNIDIKGRLPFSKMYEELEKADFMLTAYGEEQIRYNTSGTSGNFQLVFGFLKPCLITENFSPINDFNDTNAIIYDNDDKYADAMEKCINMNNEEYKILQNNLKNLQENLYQTSLNNLSNLIEKKRGKIG